VAHERVEPLRARREGGAGAHRHYAAGVLDRASPVLASASRRSVAFAAGTLLLATACGASNQPAVTRVDPDGMFVAECPGNADACVRAADEHCPDYGYLIDGNILVTRKTATYARSAADSGRLRLRCVGTLIDTHR
jgi:hypothetical protein